MKTEIETTIESKKVQQPAARDERRRHIRYERPGCLIFEYCGRRYTGAVVNISKSGVLFLADVPPPLSARGTLTLQLMDTAQPLTIAARVLRHYANGAAVEFVAPLGELDQYIPWPPNGTGIKWHAA